LDHFLYTANDKLRNAAIAQLTEDTFFIGRIFETITTAKNTAKLEIGDRFGHGYATHGNGIVCLNSKPTSAQVKRTEARFENDPSIDRRKQTQWRCGCTHKCFTTWVDSKNHLNDKRVKVTQVQGHHSNGCRPSSQQLVFHEKKSRTFSLYGKNNGTPVIHTLIGMMRYEDHVKSKTIRNLLREVMPPAVPLGAALIANVRTRAKKLLAKMEKTNRLNEIIIASQDVADLVDDSIADSLQDKLCGVDLNNPNFIGIHTKQLGVMLSEALEEGEEIDHILRFFEDAKSADECFDYRVARDHVGKVWAICYQNGNMRGHCWDGLLVAIMLDMMKRQLNSANWPYCGPIMLTGETKIACACEAIVFLETTDAYIWIMKSIYDMAGILLSVTKIIFGDGAHSVVLIKELGIEKTCNLILDQKHLLDDWKLKFGHIWATVSTLCTAIIYANTEPKYFEALDKLRLKTSSPSPLDYIEKKFIQSGDISVMRGLNNMI